MKAAFTKPATDPIHMEGEADAYPGETFANAYARLYDYGCQCGWMTSSQIDNGRGRVLVDQTHGQYRMDFSGPEAEATLVAVLKYGGRSRGWIYLWVAPGHTQTIDSPVTPVAS